MSYRLCVLLVTHLPVLERVQFDLLLTIKLRGEEKQKSNSLLTTIFWAKKNSTLKLANSFLKGSALSTLNVKTFIMRGHCCKLYANITGSSFMAQPTRGFI